MPLPLLLDRSDQRADSLRTAMAALDAGRYAAAEAACIGQAASDPADYHAMYLLGLAVAAQRRPAEASRLLHCVKGARPGFHHPAHDAVDLLLRDGDAPAAASLLESCAALAPRDPDLLYALAEARHRENDCSGALAALAPCLALRPDWAKAHVLMGILRHDCGNPASARLHFAQAADLQPDAAAPWANLAMLEKCDGRFDAAFAAYGQALARAPDDPQIRLNRAIAYLQAGVFAPGWADFERRFEVRGAGLGVPRERLLPELSSGVDLRGRRVLVMHEEGFGDTLQFVRYVPLLVERGARVLLHVPKPLLRLLGSLGGDVELITGEVSARFDFACPMMSLPRIFATQLDSIPAATPYLHADPVAREHWRARLPRHGTGPRVGLAWAGQARPWAEGFAVGNARRNIAPEMLLPLAGIPGVTLISLQRGDAPPPPGTLGVHDPMREVVDFADTAAIIDALDAVVSVDTSVAHLAGALGKPVFLLDRYDNCWRWLAGRADSPWYPSMRIFRQPARGDWASVVAAAAAGLLQLARPTQLEKFEGVTD